MITNPYPVNGLVTTNIIPDSEGETGKLNFPLAIANNEMLVFGQKKSIYTEQYYCPEVIQYQRAISVPLFISPITVLFDVSVKYVSGLFLHTVFYWDSEEMINQEIQLNTEDGESAVYHFCHCIGPINIATAGLHTFTWSMTSSGEQDRYDVNLYYCNGAWGQDIPEYQ